ncbi:RNA polymerase sigma-70 factor [Sunxiuqinia sp. A32]|uniref:RNA polymerase sigma-70 factor n=1 Tax=Sunxiuqinia sp. A32 TaxID=3461496 RepID=UPI004045CE0C
MFENDSQLLERLKNSDEIAFKVIYNKYFPRLYYYVLEFIPLKDIAENILQDTFFTLWNKRLELKDNSNLSAYLFTVVKNNCLYRLRDQRYRQKLFKSTSINRDELELNMEVLDSMDTSTFTIQEIQRIIEITLAELPPQNRNVFIMSRFKNKKNREIAEELNISVKVVEKHISKSLKVFRIALKDYLPFVAYLLIQ